MGGNKYDKLAGDQISAPDGHHLTDDSGAVGRGTTGTAPLSTQGHQVSNIEDSQESKLETIYLFADKAHQFKNVLLSFQYALQGSTDDTLAERQ